MPPVSNKPAPAAIAACLLFALMSALSAHAKDYFTLQRVGEGVWAAVAVPGSGAGANAGFVIGADGVAVVDTFEEPAAARALLDQIRNKTPLPVRYVIDTHYHLDHVAGNGVFAAAGALIFAQENVRVWERTENLKFFGKNIKPAQRQFVESLTLPGVVYRRGIDLFLGDRRLLVRSLPGHTGGDSVIIVPDANVVFTGDLFWNHTLPNLIDASTAPLVQTLNHLLAGYPAAVFVPGHGAVGHAADVTAFRDYIVTLRGAVAAARAADTADDAMAAKVVPQLQKTYGDWNWFDHFAPRNVSQTAAELAGTKRLPPRRQHPGAGVK